MIPRLPELLNEIATGVVPLRSVFQSADCDNLLDLRDSSPRFDQEYLDAFARVENLKLSLPHDPTERVRKQAFVFVAIETNNHEIASYVSDDFELIAWASYCQSDAEHARFYPEFAEWLLSEYKDGRFPVPVESDRLNF